MILIDANANVTGKWHYNLFLFLKDWYKKTKAQGNYNKMFIA